VIRVRRARRRFLLLGAAASLLAIALVVFFVSRGKNEPDGSSDKRIAASPPGTLRLTFNLPCAVYSADAERAYIAMRQRDKKTLMDMVAQRKLRMVRQGTAIVVSPVSGLAIVNIVGEAHSGTTCYIPSEMVAVVQHNGAG
jgi:hypothetical protein